MKVKSVSFSWETLFRSWHAWPNPMDASTGTNTRARHSNNGRQEKLLRLQHDFNTYLGVVTMGLQALEGVRKDADEFAELSRTIEDEGVKPLKQIVAEIVAVALGEQE